MTDGYPYDEQQDVWFGTGLRAHLGIAPIAEVDSLSLLDAPAPESPSESAGDLRDLERRAQLLELQERELAERARWVEIREAELTAETRRIEQEEARLSQRARRRVKRRAAGRPLGDVMRELAEQRMESVVLIVEDALDATLEDGTPDLPTRIAAARALLAVVSGRPADAAGEAHASAGDELAQLRKRRRSTQ
jgi:hypothetical protein